jgi:hypothetical protein
MSILSRHRSTASMAIACLALFVALGGVGYAAATINGSSIVNKSIPGKKMKDKTIGGGKVKSNSLGGTQIKESSLGTVPSAAKADTANSAATAASAQNAQNAAHASDSDSLGGSPAGSYVKGDARGLAVAGAVVNDNGAIVSWFNRAGGAPTAKANGGGDYSVTFPGIDVKNSSVVATSTIVGIFGMSTVDYSGGGLHVRTFTGNLATDTFDGDDRDFTLALYSSSNAG